MSLNPELRRNLWIELTAHRLIAAPLMLGLAFMLAGYVASESHPGVMVMTTAAVLFVIATVLWGTRQAHLSVVEEVRSGTWDIQRMSALGPFAMCFGKLAGSTAFAWYIGAFCLVVVGVAFEPLPAQPALGVHHLVGGLVLCALFMQALGLSSALVDAGTGRAAQGPRGTLVLLGMLVAVYGFGQLAVRGADAPVVWFGQPWARLDFLLGSLAAFTLWIWFGTWRLMSEQLAVPRLPWGAPLFVLFVTGYLFGFSVGEPWGSAAGLAWTGALTAVAGLYFGAVKERRDFIAVLRFLRAWRGDSLRAALTATPDWVGVAALALLFALATALLPAGTARDGLPVGDRLWMPTVALIALRDVGLLYFFSLGRAPRNAGTTAFLYLFVLHAILPALLRPAGLAVLADPALYPAGRGTWLGPSIAILHLIVVGGLLGSRLRRR